MPQGKKVREPQLLKLCVLEPVLRNKRSYSSEKPARCKRYPHSPQLEEAPTQPRRSSPRITVATTAKNSWCARFGSEAVVCRDPGSEH